MKKNKSNRHKTEIGISPKKKKWAKNVVKLGFVCGLLYFLAKKGSISIHDTSRAFSHWDKTLPAFTAMLVTMMLATIRWQLLLRAQNIHLSWKRVLQLTFIGNFFNVALPGAVSGDLVKAIYIGREVEGKRARAFGSILFDRVAGLSALIMLSALALAVGFQQFWGTPMFLAIQFTVSLAAIGMILFYLYLFLVGDHRDPFLRFLRKLEKRFKKIGTLVRIYEGLRHYHNHRATVFKIVLISIAIHLTVGWACLNFAQALGDQNLSLLAIYVIVPLGLLVTAIPILPAGIGTGHWAFLYLFQLIGSQKGADIFTLFAFVSIFFGAIGGIVYLRFRSREPLPE